MEDTKQQKKQEKRRWLFASASRRYFTRHLPVLDRHERWRRTGKLLELSAGALLRLEWMIFYDTKGEKNASLTARHFGIARKTFYAWQHRFEEDFLHGLEELSRAPKKRRARMYTPRQYERIVELRRAHIRYGKMKLLEIYRGVYPEDPGISAWKVQCIIERAGIYYNSAKQSRINRKRKRSVRRKKVTDLRLKPASGFLLCLDTVVRYWKGQKRYILTAIDRHTKVAFARMYTSHGSAAAGDFLYRLHYLLSGKIENIQTDNGSEFHKHFDIACKKLNLAHYWSRVKTPKDNAVNERFNRTLEEEFLQLGNMTADTKIFNQKLTEWLVEYNFKRPHQTLGYMPPMNFTFKYHRVLPMYPSSTIH
jgi:transposase InsO family protein